MLNRKIQPYTFWIQVSLFYWTKKSLIASSLGLSFSIHKVRCESILTLPNFDSHFVCLCLPLPLSLAKV